MYRTTWRIMSPRSPRQYGSYKVISPYVKTIARNFCSTFFVSHSAAGHSFSSQKNSERGLPDIRLCHFALVYLCCGRTGTRVDVRQRDHYVTAKTSWMDRYRNFLSYRALRYKHRHRHLCCFLNSCTYLWTILSFLKYTKSFVTSRR